MISGFPVHHIHRHPGRVRRLRSRGLVRRVSAMMVGGAGSGVRRVSHEGRNHRIFRILGFPVIFQNPVISVRKNGRNESAVFLVAAPDPIMVYMQRRHPGSTWRPCEGANPAKESNRKSQENGISYHFSKSCDFWSKKWAT